MKQSRSLTPAVAYLRTSSAANVGADKDSEKRQRETIQAFAPACQATTIVEEFYDAAVSGADAIEARAGFRHHAQADRGQRRPHDHRRDGEPVRPRSHGAGGRLQRC